MSRKTTLKIGDWLESSTGIYEITGFREKGDSLVTVKEVIFADDENSDNYTLGQESYFTEYEVKKIIHHSTGKRVDDLMILGTKEEIAMRKVLNECDLPEEIVDMIEYADNLTINTGRNGQKYAWYVDDNHDVCMNIDTLEIVSEEEIEEQLL